MTPPHPHGIWFPRQTISPDATLTAVAPGVFLSMQKNTMKTTTSGISCVCGSTDFAVIRTTTTRGGILRRRECESCGERLTTRERPICSARANTPATGIGQLVNSLSLLSDRTVALPLPPKN